MKAHACTIRRTCVVTHGTLNMHTGDTHMDRRETVTKECGTPLFGRDLERGICRGCAAGWEHPDNRFADDAERQRAVASA